MTLAHGSPSPGNAARTGQGSTRSIGEVLGVLKAEFDDITISKIRFLESEGLVTPQRTPSGYRKFSESDIQRLRFILRQQRENFLPLKVIRERLEQESGLASPPSVSAVETNQNPTTLQTSPVDRAKPQPTPAPEPRPEQPVTAASETNIGLPAGPMSRRELVEASGLTESRLRDLENFGLLQGERTTTGLWYEGQALAIARLAARFLHFGVEPRHLRIFRTAADREADLYKQLVMPQKASRSAQAQTESRARMEELTSLGASLHDELLRQALDRH
jgi:DNA-binding transcriptional MerR regulator